jgi:hypothetical protein
MTDTGEQISRLLHAAGGEHRGPRRCSWPRCQDGRQAGEYTSHEMALGGKVAVGVCDRVGARIFGNGRLAVWLWILPPVAGNQQLIRVTARIWARLSKETSRWHKEP